MNEEIINAMKLIDEEIIAESKKFGAKKFFGIKEELPPA